MKKDISYHLNILFETSSQKTTPKSNKAFLKKILQTRFKSEVIYFKISIMRVVRLQKKKYVMKK